MLIVDPCCGYLLGLEDSPAHATISRRFDGSVTAVVASTSIYARFYVTQRDGALRGVFV